MATTLWGASSAILAKVGRADGTGAPLLAAGGAAALAVVAWARPARTRVSRTPAGARYPRRLILIGLIEALNLLLYASALALGPVPVIVALHLTSPIVLVVLAVLRGHRRLDVMLVVQILLLVSGLVLLATQPAGGPGHEPLLAGVLAVSSAVAVAGLITAVSRLAPTVNPDCAAAAQLTIAAVLTAPVILIASPPTGIDTAILLGAGGLFLGPGFAVYWRALRGVTAATAGILGLNEAVAATIISITVFGATMTLTSALSGILVLGAIVLETFRVHTGNRASTARLGDKTA